MPREIGVQLGPRIRKKLIARIVHRGMFAKSIGIHEVSLSRVLTGAVAPSRQMLKKICHALDLEVEVRMTARVWPKYEGIRRSDGSIVVDEYEHLL